jgi:hypothetical protein
MKILRAYSKPLKISPYPRNLFKRNVRKFLSVTCLMFFFVMLCASSQTVMTHEQVKRQIKPVETSPRASIVRNFSLKGSSREVIELEMKAAGKIEMKAEWRGTASSLALILNGPGQRQAYARKDGQSPLSLSYRVSQSLLSLGKTWKVSVVNFNPRTTAGGRVRITFPEAPTVAAPEREIIAPKPKEKEAAVAPQKPMEEKKSLTLKYYEIVEAKGYTGRELRQIRAELRAKKVAAAKANIQTRIEEIAPKNPFTKIVVPLLYQRLEEKSKSRTAMRKYTRSISPKKQIAQHQIDIPSHLQTMVEAYKELPSSFKRQYFDSRYAQLKPGQRVDKLQLGKDILSAIKPNYKSEIREKVRKAFGPEAPKFKWDSTKIGSLKPVRAARLAAKPSQLQIMKLDSVASRLRKAPSLASQRQLKELVQAQGFPVAGVHPAQIQQAIIDMLQLQPRTIPDLNNEHTVRNYYKYEVLLDNFLCADKEEYQDEPYFILTSVVPRYDPDDPDQLPKLKDGNLYNVYSRVTGSYSDVESGSERGIRDNDRLIFSANTYNSTTTFTIDLWEEDWSKYAATAAILDAVEDIREELIDEIKESVLEALKDALYESLKESLPEELQQVLYLFFEGELSFSSLMNSIQNALGGIDIGWIALEIIFSGKSFTDIITGLGGACPEITIAILAIKVVGPILIESAEELFSGDFMGALKTLLSLPVELLNSVIDLFTDIVEFFENIVDLFKAIMATVDPDDHIQAHSVTINGSFDDIKQDADWGGFICVSLDQADDFRRRKGFGPTTENSSFLEYNRVCQPGLNFQSSNARYMVYYNVKRVLAGGRETFGYTVKSDSDSLLQTRTYKAKSRGRNEKIKVSICALNTEQVPFVWMSKIAAGGETASVSNGNLGGQREFYVDSIPGAEYELLISWFGDGAIYGYVTVEEK